VTAEKVLDLSAPLFDEKRIAELNADPTVGWKASSRQGRFFDGINVKQYMALLGTRLTESWKNAEKTMVTYDPIALPESFDSRVNWPNCSTIGWIRDQSACGSCWAFGAGEAISDRYCTLLGKTDSKYWNFNISASDLNSCCSSCGDGCGGGFPNAAWEYWVKHGLATSECMPYPLPNCEHHIPQNHYPVCPSQEYPTPPCEKQCKDGSAPVFYKGTKATTASGEQGIMQEIFTNGPVEVAFSVYADFEAYKSGIYKKTSNQFLGGHAVKMLGWGVLNGVKYWIVNNSWNADWGMDGSFWIIKGVNECGIENAGWGGVPAPF
jgi:cysteine peptidase C